MSLSKNWELHIDPSVQKGLSKLPRHDVKSILEAIHLLPADPYFGDIQKMRDEENAWRRRVGAYRIFYRIKTAENVILVFRIERRTSKTY